MVDQFVTTICTKSCPVFHLIVSLEIRRGVLCLELIAKEGLQSEIQSDACGDVVPRLGKGLTLLSRTMWIR